MEWIFWEITEFSQNHKIKSTKKFKSNISEPFLFLYV